MASPINKLNSDVVYSEIKSYGIKIKTHVADYKNTTTKLLLVCPKCNNDFERSFNKLKTSHKMCASCAKKFGGFAVNTLTIEHCKKIAKEKGCELLTENYINSTTKMKFLGKCGHEYETTWNFFLNDNKHQCNACSEKNRGYSLRLPYSEIVKTCKHNNTKLITTQSQWDSKEHKYPIIECPKCGAHFERINKYIKKSITKLCSKCAGALPVSSYENELVEYLQSKNIKIEQSNRKLLDGKEIDVYLPKYNLGIEINGVYHHSEQFKPDKYTHFNKTELAKQKNIKLLQFWDIEWINKKDIVLSIINSKLGISEQIYDARKLTVEIVETDVAKSFLNSNHIQGVINSKANIGLFDGT